MADDTQRSEIVEWLKRGLRGGLGFGIAVSIAHLAHGIGLIMVLGLPPLTRFAMQSIVMELVLAVRVGVALSPLYARACVRRLHK